MALIYMDGFDAGDHAPRWTTVSSNPGWTTTRTLTTGRLGTGQALQVASSSTSAVGVDTAGVTRYFTAAPTLYFGAAVMVNYSGAGSQLLHFGGFGGYGNIGIWLSASLGITVWRHVSAFEWSTSSGTGLASASEGLVVNQWAYLEVMVTVADVGGRVVIKKNGNTILDYTGDTRSHASVTGTDHVILAGNTNNVRFATWDDIYIADSTGTNNNDFLGDIQVSVLTPNGNGTYSQLTGSDGNSTDNYLLVNDALTPASYVEGVTVGNKDSYALSDTTGVDIKAVQTAIQGDQVDAGAAAINPFLRVSGVDYMAPTQNLGQGTVNTHVFDVNPATSSPWTQTDINNTELGIEIA